LVFRCDPAPFKRKQLKRGIYLANGQPLEPVIDIVAAHSGRTHNRLPQAAAIVLDMVHLRRAARIPRHVPRRIIEEGADRGRALLDVRDAVVRGGVDIVFVTTVRSYSQSIYFVL
jgi:hypothetical protein